MSVPLVRSIASAGSLSIGRLLPSAHDPDLRRRQILVVLSLSRPRLGLSEHSMPSFFALIVVLFCLGGRLAVLAAGLDPSIVGSSRIDDVQEQEQVSQKEVCFMELYEASQVSSLSYQKETLIKDEFSRSVYLTDGFKKDETEQEWYYKSFCYKAFHYSSHKEKTFGDSNAASIVDGGLGGAMRNTNVESNGIDANDGTLKKFTEDEQGNKGGLGKNY